MKIKEIPKKISIFFNEVKMEVKKVNWPSAKETTRDTIIIISVSVVVAIFLGGVDLLFTAILDKLIL